MKWLAPPRPWSPRVAIALLAMAALLLVLFGLLAAQVAHTSGPLWVDLKVWRVTDSARLAEVMGGKPLNPYLAPPHYAPLTRFGSPKAAVLVLVILTAWVAWHRDWRGAAFLAGGPAVAIVATQVLWKPLVGRTNFLGQDVFPSGHVTAATAIAAGAVVLIARYHGWIWASVAMPFGAAVPLLTGLGAVGRHWHYFTDTAGAAIVTLATVFFAAAALLASGKRLHFAGTPQENAGAAGNT